LKITIKDNSFEPIYYQIYRQIKEFINNKQLKPNEQLPTERELNKLLGVSRITIRKAIKFLMSEGLCYRKQGKGIFVSRGRILLEIETIRGTENLIRSKGMKINTQVILKRIINCNDYISAKLEVPKESKILFLKRLRLINNEPLIIENAYLSLDRMSGLEKYNFAGSLYKILEENYHLIPNHSEGSLIYKLVDEENFKLLNVPLNYPIIEKNVVVYTKEDTPIELVHSFYRSDRFEFQYHGFCR
jgi:GntR family transcriptional regulator